MKPPPEEVSKALQHLEISLKALKDWLHMPEARPYDLDHAIDVLVADTEWLKGTVKEFIKETTGRGY